MSSNTDPTSEEQIREIAREEAEDVVELSVDGPEGDSWSISDMMERFNVSRRTALKAIGLVAVGYAAPRAVLASVSDTAEAAATDNLTVPGQLTADSVSTIREFTTSRTGSVVVHKAGGKWHADGPTGGIVSSNTDFATVAQAAADHVAGNGRRDTIVLHGSGDVTSTVSFGDHTMVVCNGEFRLADAADTTMFAAKTGSFDVSWYGGLLHGNNSNNAAGSCLDLSNSTYGVVSSARVRNAADKNIISPTTGVVVGCRVNYGNGDGIVAESDCLIGYNDVGNVDGVCLKANASENVFVGNNAYFAGDHGYFANSEQNQIIGGVYSENGGNGIRLGVDANNTIVSGALIKSNGTDTSKTDANRVGLRYASTDSVFTGLRIHDDQNTKTQTNGVYADGDYNILDCINMRGNINNGYLSTPGANSQEGIVIL